MKGIAYGVGVGPGDPELMTLKAVRLIRENDVIATLALITDPISRVGARLRYLKGLQWKEVADVMNCTASAIEQQVRRAMRGVIPGGRNSKCK